jgi:hypothetical protein
MFVGIGGYHNITLAHKLISSFVNIHRLLPLHCTLIKQVLRLRIMKLCMIIHRLSCSQLFTYNYPDMFRSPLGSFSRITIRYNNSYVSIPGIQTFKRLRLFGYNFSLPLNASRQLNFKTTSVMSGKEALSVLSTAPTFLLCVLSSTFPVVECSLYSSLDSQPVYKYHWINIVVRYYTGLGALENG